METTSSLDDEWTKFLLKKKRNHAENDDVVATVISIE